MTLTKTTSRGVHFNYFFDGPCGDCPKALNMRACEQTDSNPDTVCIHWQAWLEIERTVLNLKERYLEAEA